MSHFVVIVVGDDHEAALTPFDEELKAPSRREYLDDDIARMSEHYKTTERKVLAAKMENWRGTKGGVDRKGRLYQMATYNKNAKWDWYEVGGRWKGYFLLKDGTRVDRCRKGDVDADAMMAVREQAARERWAAYVKAIGDTPPHTKRKVVCERHGGDTDAAQAEYWAQPRVKVLSVAGLYDADDFPETEAAMVARWRAKALCTFALLVDGEWHERGSMGWFACVSNEKDDWPAEFARLWAEIPDDATVTAVDCHI